MAKAAIWPLHPSAAVGPTAGLLGAQPGQGHRGVGRIDGLPRGQAGDLISKSIVVDIESARWPGRALDDLAAGITALDLEPWGWQIVCNASRGGGMEAYHA